MCAHVCIWIYMSFQLDNTYAYIFGYTCVCPWIHMSVSEYLDTHVRVCVRVCLHAWILMCVCLFIFNMNAQTIKLCIYLSKCMCVCVYMCMHVCMSLIIIYAHAFYLFDIYFHLGNIFICKDILKITTSPANHLC